VPVAPDWFTNRPTMGPDNGHFATESQEGTRGRRAKLATALDAPGAANLIGRAANGSMGN
jgi:hypothetical protein